MNLPELRKPKPTIHRVRIIHTESREKSPSKIAMDM